MRSRESVKSRASCAAGRGPQKRREQRAGARDARRTIAAEMAAETSVALPATAWKLTRTTESGLQDAVVT